MTKGRFIVFEGGEGSGKSTQIQLLSAFLAERGIPFVQTREPGGTPNGEEARQLLVRGDADRWDRIGEILLFSAIRREHLVKKVWPALEEGKTVVCDRFLDSTIAYQGYGHGYNPESIQAIQTVYRLVGGDFHPDLTILLDISPEIGLTRSTRRAGNTDLRFEHLDIQFHQRLREGYLQLAQQNKERYAVISAENDINAIQSEIRRILLERKLC